MTTTDNIVHIYPEAVDQPGHGTPEDLAQQVFYEIEIVVEDPTESWERFTAKLAELRAAFPQAAANQTSLFS
jgi:hypothetical protein